MTSRIAEAFSGEDSTIALPFHFSIISHDAHFEDSSGPIRLVPTANSSIHNF